MDHRTALATFRTFARRTGTTAGRTALTVAHEVSTRIAERRSSRSSTPPGWAPPVPADPPRTSAEPQVGRGPSPVDVARAVARNEAGLPRTNPALQRRRPPRRSVPGAKLPVRRGIVGA